MFGWLRRAPKEPQVGGIIAFLGLEDWWMHEFTPEEREIVRRTTMPLGLGDQPIDAGSIAFSSQTISGFASSLAGWFNKEEMRHIGYKFLRKADEFSKAEDLPPISLHFAMQARCQFFYRWRNHDEFALPEAIKACERGISISKKAAAAFKEQWGSVDASHHCFKQLAIIEEKQGNFKRAIALCDQAEEDGWNGDWEKRRLRLMKKQAAYRDSSN